MNRVQQLEWQRDQLQRLLMESEREVKRLNLESHRLGVELTAAEARISRFEALMSEVVDEHAFKVDGVTLDWARRASAELHGSSA